MGTAEIPLAKRCVIMRAGDCEVATWGSGQPKYEAARDRGGFALHVRQDLRVHL